VGVLIERSAIVAALAGVAACYSPELPECVHACATPDDCAPDQTCGSDRLCASPDIAGHCDQLGADAPTTPRPDANDDEADAGRLDARPHPDAEEDVAILRIDIDGRGKVKLGPPLGGDCHSDDASGAVCARPVVSGTDITLTSEDGHGWSFVSYTHCSPATAPTCVVTVGPGTTTVTATFEPD
jgi:hypothetical protein